MASKTREIPRTERRAKKVVDDSSSEEESSSESYEEDESGEDESEEDNFEAKKKAKGREVRSILAEGKDFLNLNKRIKKKQAIIKSILP